MGVVIHTHVPDLKMQMGTGGISSTAYNTNS